MTTIGIQMKIYNIITMARKKKTTQFKAKPNKKGQQAYKENMALIKKLIEN